MTPSQPIACRPEAYHVFAAQLPTLSTNRGLLRAAVAISMHEHGHVDLQACESKLLEIAERIRDRIRNPLSGALLAHLHDELFQRMGLRGNEEDYYNADNSYVPMVLETGRGLPISLSLVYAVLARELGLRADGINAPGHFLVQVAGDGRPMFVDPFYRGELLTRAEALERVAEAVGRPLDRGDDVLRPATHARWIMRMLHNLVNVFATEGRSEDVAAMSEMMALVDRSR